MSEPPPWAEVALSVYELHGTSALNFVTSSAGIGGAYHVGVEVYGLEWSFGGADLGTGIYMVHVGESSLGNFHSRIPLGKTRKTPEQVLDILAEFRRTWRGNEYHLLARNCAHFSVAFSTRLGFRNQPDWINAFANAGAGWTGAQAEASTGPREEDNLDSFDDDELEEFTEDGDHIAMLELVWRRGKEYTMEWVEQARHDARYEDLLVEFRWAVGRDDAKNRNAVLGVMRHEDLRRAVAESTASALGLRWDRTAEEDSCPVKVSKFQTLSGLRVSVTCRVTGGENTKKIRSKPDQTAFAAKFKPAMKSAVPWPSDQKAVMDTIQIDTSPGQPARSHRVLNCSQRGGGEIYFPRREFKTPDSVHRTLAKLQNLRVTVMEQSGVQRSLKVMQPCVTTTPWWAS